MRKVLVTGATGFVGSYVVEQLLKQNVEVIASSSDKQKAEQKNWYHQVNYVPFDFANYSQAENYFKFFSEPDSLIHLAWEGLPNYKSRMHLEINLPRHIAFLTNLIQNGLRNLTVTGTCLEYGMQEGRLSEDMQALPLNPYAIAKDSLRKYLQNLQHKYSFSLKWVRLFYVYGKGQNPNSLLSQLDTALESGADVFNMSAGEQVRDYLPVEKAAEYIVKISLQHAITGVINCCSGKPITVRQFVENYLRSKNKKMKLNLGYYPYTDYEPMAFWGDEGKLKSIINE